VTCVSSSALARQIRAEIVSHNPALAKLGVDRVIFSQSGLGAVEAKFIAATLHGTAAFGSHA
jgi:hypothetical protein